MLRQALGVLLLGLVAVAGQYQPFQDLQPKSVDSAGTPAPSAPTPGESAQQQASLGEGGLLSFLIQQQPLVSSLYGGGTQGSVTDKFQSSGSYNGVNQTRAEQAAQAPATGNALSFAQLPPGTVNVDKLAKGLDDAFAGLSNQGGLGWLAGKEEPGFGSGRFLDFWRLRSSDMEGLITPKGYPAERYKTLTQDGYILTNFRIPYGKDGPNGTALEGSGVARQPVLLLHGISLSSTCWVINNYDQSLAFILADEGYDVWMINTRGNGFSMENVNYPVSDPRFWNFSIDELALSDLPATITYIQRVTDAQKVHVVGHSQGGTMGVALLSRRTEAEQNIGVFLAVAPVVYAKYMLSPTLVAFCKEANTSIASNLPPQEYLFMSSPMQVVFLSGLCQLPSLTPVCKAATESMFGTSLYITTTQYQKYWKVWPSPTSYYDALQWGQIYNEPQPVFMAFNYGPEYNLTRIRVPTILFRGGRDVLATPQDLSIVEENLATGGSLGGVHFTQEFGHMDYIWDTGAKDRVYGLMMQALARYTDPGS